ncbi:Bromodomain and PHD finger-containing protein 3 [Camellia lanceoleosa]|uniref:Bromodomain and PHD finger-containing protein 3 n=1 Tax=Camellia lanceoleosa TaxID=1840588 RepID=A0ACC0FCU2_9ERIC|nr:Bromodomain and PHD finger-containing protein 3 [Camellia lanceoleosa]
MVDQKGRGGRNRKRARILANGTLKMVNSKHNLNDIPSTNSEVQLIQQVANADYSGTPLSLPLTLPATGMEASSSQQPSPKHRRGQKKKRLDEVGLFTEQGGEKPKHKVPAVNGVFPSTQQMPEKCTLELVLEKLQRIDIHKAFAHPVDSNEVKDYYKFITNPMDFGTMRAKLHEGTYTTLEQFENDVFLICSNAMCFNAPTTNYYKQAHAIHNLAKRLFNNLKNNPKAMDMEYLVPRRRVRRSQGEGGCLGIKLCAKLSGENQSKIHFFKAYFIFIEHNGKTQFLDGQNVKLCETERRQTYKPLTSIINEKSIFSMFHSSLKQLVPGNGRIKYKESLMQFVKDLGPTARKMANQKLQCLTQTPSHHFQGSSLQISSLAAQQRPSCREHIINVVTPYANNSLGIHDASSREKNILSRENIDMNSNACRGQMVLGGGRLEIQDTISKGKNVIKGGSIDPYGGVNKGKNVVKGDGTNPYVCAYGRHTTLIGWANFQGDTTRIHSALQWARAGGTDKKVIDQTLNDMASIIGPSSGSILSSKKKDLLAQVLEENSCWQSESTKSWPGFEFPTFQNEGLNNTSANFKYTDLLQEAIREDFAHSSQNAPNYVFSYPPNYRTSNINDWPTEMIDSFRSQSRLVELLCGGNRHPKSSVYPSKVVNPSSTQSYLGSVVNHLEWNHLHHGVHKQLRRSDPRNDDYNGREGEASCKSTSVVAETVSGMGKAISRDACAGREVALVMSTINVQNGANRHVDDDISNPGLLKSLSGSDLIRPGLNIEVVLTKAHELNCVETQTHKAPEIRTLGAQSNLEDSIQPCSGEETLA